MTTALLPLPEDDDTLIRRSDLSQYLPVATQTLARWATEGHSLRGHCYHHFEARTYKRINETAPFDNLRCWIIPNLTQDSGICPLISQFRAKTGQ